METTVTTPALDDLRIVGGHLALDFVNTRSGPTHGGVDTEWLSSYADFAAWGQQAGLAGPAGDVSVDEQPAAIAAFARVLACRDDLYEVFLAVADGQAPPEAALRRVQLTYLEALSRGRLAGASAGGADSAGAGRLGWSWVADGGLLAPLWPVAAAAVDLLTRGPVGHVKSCQACRFLFIDQSKNGSRRWCSMDDCGKTAKIARYLERRSLARQAR